MAPPRAPSVADVPLKDAAPRLGFMLFAGGDPRLARAAVAAGVERVVVDLERRGKGPRQHGYHLEASAETFEDLRRLRRAVKATLVCRVNPVHPGTRREIDAAIKGGADILMLPMFRHKEEVEAFLKIVAGRARTILLFETPEALALAPRLGSLSFDEAYVGLNDLGVALGATFSYEVLASGVVDRLRAALPSKPFGFGGLTVLDGGAPLPTRLIVEEQARLRCSWAILRRAFKRDVKGRDMGRELAALRRHYARCASRPKAEVRAKRRRLLATIAEISELLRASRSRRRTPS